MEANNIPTIALASEPTAAASYRLLRVQLTASIALAINLLIITMTTIYVWKLWQREDKSHVEETWCEDDQLVQEQGRPHGAMTVIRRPIVSAATLDTCVLEGRVKTPESLTAARRGVWSPETTTRPKIAQRQLGRREDVKAQRFEAATARYGVAAAHQLQLQALGLATREALAQRGISSPFTVKADMPHDIHDPAWDPQGMLADVTPHEAVSMPIRKTVQLSFFSPSIESKVSVGNGDSGEGEKTEYHVEPGDAGAAAPERVRHSGIDWNDNEDGVIKISSSSSSTGHSSEVGRDSYVDRYADY